MIDVDEDEDIFDDMAKCGACGYWYCTCCGCDCFFYDEEGGDSDED